MEKHGLYQLANLIAPIYWGELMQR